MVELFDYWYTEKQKELLLVMSEGKTLTEACAQLHISKQTGGMRLRAVREVYKRAKSYTNDYEAVKAKLPSRYL